MAQNSYQEPIEKEDMDLRGKFRSGADQSLANPEKDAGKIPETPIPSAENSPVKEEISSQGETPAPNPEKDIVKEEKPLPAETPEAKEAGPAGLEKEAGMEGQEEKIGEKIETARKTISVHKPGSAAAVSDDANTVAGITEYEKKVDKLIELALQKGPEHAIKVARHMDASDNYTLDELHDRMLEDDLRKQLIQKGLLKEL